VTTDDYQDRRRHRRHRIVRGDLADDPAQEERRIGGRLLRVAPSAGPNGNAGPDRDRDRSDDQGPP